MYRQQPSLIFRESDSRRNWHRATYGHLQQQPWLPAFP